MQAVHKAIPTGRRERKRAETFARIQIEAIRLFIERGFDATTLDDIADAADVSRRSLFHYFDSKEEIVYSTKAQFPALVADAVSRRPANEPLLDMVENALIDMGKGYQSSQTRALAKLIRDTPALNAGDQAKYEEIERSLASALADRKHRPPTDMACRVTAATSVGVLKLALATWLQQEDSDFGVHCRAAFYALRRVAGSNEGS